MIQQAERPLRIGLLVSYFHPFASGAERQALAQAIELVRRGHVVHVVTRSVQGYPIDEEEYQGVRIHRWIRTSSRGPLFALSFVAGAAWSLRRLRQDLDVVHTHQALWEAVATGLTRPWLCGTPTLVQPAASGYYGEAEELRRTRGAKTLRKIILKNSAFSAISAEIEREWLALGVPAEHLVRTASGVDAEHFKPGPSLVESGLLPRPRVVFTGRLHPQKNLPLLLNAWVRVSRQTSANLILIGPGSERQSLMELSASLGVNNRVQFVGAVSDPAQYLRAADLFVLPSLAEGMSNSLLEAMATGLPCVVSGIGGNTDLVIDGQTGRLVNGADADHWASALIDLLNHPEKAAQMGESARKLILDRYSLRAVVDRNLAIYRSLIARDWGA